MIEQKTLFCLFEECKLQNDEDGCVVGMAGGPVYHASPTLLLMSVEESLQFFTSKYYLNVCICCFKNHISHNPHKIL